MLYSNREAISLSQNEMDLYSGYAFAILAQTTNVYLHLLASLPYKGKCDVSVSKWIPKTTILNVVPEVNRF